jgi:hypothetical protein
MANDSFEVASFRLDPGGPVDGPIPERKVELASLAERKGRRFIPPVPMPWFDRACVLPGKALAVGHILWYLAKRQRASTVVLTQAALDQHGLGRWSKYDALRGLEAAGLIQVHRRPKKNPVVTLLDPPAGPTPGDHVSQSPRS